MDLDASTRPVVRDKPVFLLHIPKTGGNTIVAQFLSHLPIEAVWPPPPALVLDEQGLREAAARLPGLRFIHGHVETGLTTHLPTDALRMVTFVRHPVRLAVSHYLYLRQKPGNRLHAAAMALRIDDFYRRFPGMISEPQTGYLARALGFPISHGAPLGAEGVAFALDALADLDFVGVTERMAESVEAMAETLGLPLFPVGRENAGHAPRTEAEDCAGRLMRDEFLMRLGADFALRRAAEARLAGLQRSRRRDAMAERLLRGLAGQMPMPETIADAPGLALGFLEGWLPQGWSGEPCSAKRYWWTRQRATLLLAAAAPVACTLRLVVVNTMRFDAAAITARVDGRPLAVTASLIEDGGAVALDIAIPAEALMRGSVEIALIPPHALPFSELDPSVPDHEPRGFAVRDFGLHGQSGVAVFRPASRG
ncbi:MAG TPA: hypothetical protein VD970_15965 [Acetobacteraceae bacterium]|nr:hypothetical protein [Acetobacteraceae bacterium]